MGGEPKTEFWYIADAAPGAELYVGITPESSRAAFQHAIERGTADEHLHRIAVKAGDAMFLPSGRVHAIGGGNVIVEIQQNSDTTYRVFDWNRTDASGTPRKLHIEESLRCIDFDDRAPVLIQRDAGQLVRNELFEVERWSLDRPREGVTQGRFAIVCCLTGTVSCAGVMLAPGNFCLLPASLTDPLLHSEAPETTLLRITIPA